MAPKFVTLYRISGKRGKTDAADAAAICGAVSRANLHFVPVKEEHQQIITLDTKNGPRIAGPALQGIELSMAMSELTTTTKQRYGLAGGYRPSVAITFGLRNRSTSSMKPTEGTSNSNAVIDAIW